MWLLTDQKIAKNIIFDVGEITKLSQRFDYTINCARPFLHKYAVKILEDIYVM